MSAVVGKFLHDARDSGEREREIKKKVGWRRAKKQVLKKRSSQIVFSSLATSLVEELVSSHLPVSRLGWFLQNRISLKSFWSKHQV